MSRLGERAQSALIQNQSLMVGVLPCRQRDGIFTRLVESAETSMDIVTGTTQQLEIFSAARKNVKVRVESQQFAQKDV